MDYSTFAGHVKKTDATVAKLDLAYNHADSRCWTALVNQGTDNILVTHSINRGDYGTKLFDVVSSSRILVDLEADDIFDVLDMLINRPPVVEVAE